jgi:hypothetical protein
MGTSVSEGSVSRIESYIPLPLYGEQNGSLRMILQDLSAKKNFTCSSKNGLATVSPVGRIKASVRISLYRRALRGVHPCIVLDIVSATARFASM